MESVEKQISISKTARYYVIPPVERPVKKVLIVIHGYAQLAKDFIEEFRGLINDHVLIAAPEGLSKFYFRNEPAASWMTKEDRENEISDYLLYLDKFINSLKTDFDITGAEISLLGFSQGVHTAVRWFIHSPESFSNLILCSSDFPKDADINMLKEKLINAKMQFIYGTKDEVITLQRYQESMDLLKTNNVIFDELSFEGGHRINLETLQLKLKKHK